MRQPPHSTRWSRTTRNPTGLRNRCSTKERAWWNWGAGRSRATRSSCCGSASPGVRWLKRARESGYLRARREWGARAPRFVAPAVFAAGVLCVLDHLQRKNRRQDRRRYQRKIPLVDQRGAIFVLIEHAGLQQLQGFDHSFHQVIGLRYGGAGRIDGGCMRREALLDSAQVGRQVLLQGGGTVGEILQGPLHIGNAPADRLNGVLHACDDLVAHGSHFGNRLSHAPLCVDDSAAHFGKLAAQRVYVAGCFLHLRERSLMILDRK